MPGGGSCMRHKVTLLLALAALTAWAGWGSASSARLQEEATPEATPPGPGAAFGCISLLQTGAADSVDNQRLWIQQTIIPPGSSLTLPAEEYRADVLIAVAAPD